MYSYSYPTYTVYKRHSYIFNRDLHENKLIEFFERLMKKYENK